MDPISFGGTLAAAMELYEMGVITAPTACRSISATPRR